MIRPAVFLLMIIANPANLSAQWDAGIGAGYNFYHAPEWLSLVDELNARANQADEQLPHLKHGFTLSADGFRQLSKRTSAGMIYSMAKVSAGAEISGQELRARSYVHSVSLAYRFMGGASEGIRPQFCVYGGLAYVANIVLRFNSDDNTPELARQGTYTDLTWVAGVSLGARIPIDKYVGITPFFSAEATGRADTPGFAGTLINAPEAVPEPDPMIRIFKAGIRISMPLPWPEELKKM